MKKPATYRVNTLLLQTMEAVKKETGIPKSVQLEQALHGYFKKHYGHTLQRQAVHKK